MAGVQSKLCPCRGHVFELSPTPSHIAGGSDSDYDFEADWGSVPTGNAFEQIADATTSGEEEEEEGEEEGSEEME